MGNKEARLAQLAAAYKAYKDAGGTITSDSCDWIRAAVAAVLEAAAPAQAGGEAHNDGVALIAQERRRQVEAEGWTAEHDALHNPSDLARAGICYAAQGVTQLKLKTHETCDTINWPWDYKWWKPSPDPIRNLVKAAALIAAEIDRQLKGEDDDEVS